MQTHIHAKILQEKRTTKLKILCHTIICIYMSMVAILNDDKCPYDGKIANSWSTYSWRAGILAHTCNLSTGKANTCSLASQPSLLGELHATAKPHLSVNQKRIISQKHQGRQSEEWHPRLIPSLHMALPHTNEWVNEWINEMNGNSTFHYTVTPPAPIFLL